MIYFTTQYFIAPFYVLTRRNVNHQYLLINWCLTPVLAVFQLYPSDHPYLRFSFFLIYNCIGDFQTEREKFQSSKKGIALLM